MGSICISENAEHKAGDDKWFHILFVDNYIKQVCKYSNNNSNSNKCKVEMSLSLSKPMLDAYKTIGCFADGPVAASQTQPFSLAVVCKNSYKVYSDQLSIKMVSPCFNGPILAIHIHNQHTYVVVGTHLIKTRYHHIISQWQLPASTHHQQKQIKQSGKASILVFEGVIIVSAGNKIYLVPDNKRNQQQAQSRDIQVMNLAFDITQIIHPVTYINKILAYNATKILLINPLNQKILFDYSAALSQIIADDNKIQTALPTPLIDIVAVCFKSGEIIILNIRTSKIIFTMKQKKSVTAIAFSPTDSFMASADACGNIILWDLQNKNIVYRLQSAFPQAVDSLHFVPGISLIVATSAKSNSIKQFRINLNDNKTLTMFRQRTGCFPSNPIIGVKCHNNKQITFSTKSQTVFSSLYSHCNMYKLPSSLDSQLPYHLVAKNFTLQVYREQTLIGKLNIHESAHLGKFSFSNKFIVVGTKSKILKIAIPGGVNPSTQLHLSYEWKVVDAKQIILCNEKYLYVFCFQSICVFAFNEPNLIKTINEGNHCYNGVSNDSQNMLALQNRDKNTIQIWDMLKIAQSRIFTKGNKMSDCTKLCFTPDNRYLLSAHVDHTISIWSVLQSALYKTIRLQSKIVQMVFTPDNGYLLSVFEGAKEINIWNNYIGKIVSSQSQTQMYHFITPLNYLSRDYRQKLQVHKHLYEIETGVQNFTELDSILDQIDDAADIQNCNYNFGQVNKWMPLVYYDQIKNRNSINNDEQIPSLPFFLDFKNLTQEQQKISKKAKEQLKDKKSKQQQKIDQQLDNITHQIRLTENSTEIQYEKVWLTLCKMNVAEVDYQLRRFIMVPGNIVYLLKMGTHILAEHKYLNLMIANIVLTRILDLAGSEVCTQLCKEEGRKLFNQIEDLIIEQQQTVEKCIAVATHGL